MANGHCNRSLPAAWKYDESPTVTTHARMATLFDTRRVTIDEKQNCSLQCSFEPTFKIHPPSERGALPPSVMAIGDAVNDVSMLQAAGVAVAMDNAHPLVKQAADWIAPSNNDHGVYAALRRYGLCE